MKVELNQAINYTQGLGFTETSNFLLDFLLNESDITADSSGIFVNLTFEVDSVQNAVILTEREEKMRYFENNRRNLLNKKVNAISEKSAKIKELQEKVKTDSKNAHLHRNNIDKIINSDKINKINEKLERNAKRIEQIEQRFAEKIGTITLREKISTEILIFEGKNEVREVKSSKEDKKNNTFVKKNGTDTEYK